jgi:hypothetical protein
VRHQASHHLQRALVLALATAAILVMPAAAEAAYVKVDAGRLTFTTLSGEANRLTVTSSVPGTVQLSEAGHLSSLPVLIAGCGTVAAKITCSGVSSLAIDTGNGDDVVSARDGIAELITCGSGIDTATVDATDVVSECETVDRSAAAQPQPQQPATNPGPGTGGNPAPTTPVDPGAPGGGTSSGLADPFVNLAPPTIPVQTAAVTKSGVALVQVACPPDAGTCRGTVELVMLDGASAKRPARIVAARRRKVAGTKIGSAKFTAKAGEKPVIRIRLNRRGRQRILRNRHTRCRLVVTTQTATGQTVTTTRDIGMQLQRRGATRPRKKR